MALWAQHGGCPGTLVLTCFLLPLPCRTSTVWPPICPRTPRPCSWTPSRISTSCSFWSPMRSCLCRYGPSVCPLRPWLWGAPGGGCLQREAAFPHRSEQGCGAGSTSFLRPVAVALPKRLTDRRWSFAPKPLPSVPAPGSGQSHLFQFPTELRARRRGALAIHRAVLRAERHTSAALRSLPSRVRLRFTAVTQQAGCRPGPERSAAELAFLRCAVGEKRAGVTDSGCSPSRVGAAGPARRLALCAFFSCLRPKEAAEGGSDFFLCLWLASVPEGD